MWANRDWIGALYAADARPGQLLAPYSRVFGAVEGNTTFYGLPSAATVARWQREAAPGFRFMFKLPRAITHERRLRDAGSELREFCERLAPLEPVRGPTSIQLPASFGPDHLGELGRFLEVTPASWGWAVEVRHPAFFDGGPAERALNDLLYEHGADRVILDSRALFSAAPRNEVERVAHGAKPRLPVRPTATGRQPVVRFIGHLDAEVSAAHWARWFPVVLRWLEQDRAPLLFFHTADNVEAPSQALRFHRELADASSGSVAPPPAGAVQDGGPGAPTLDLR
ncbi:MAG: DUF72 domain-containing protein [Acidimicrobiia bacterium]